MAEDEALFVHKEKEAQEPAEQDAQRARTQKEKEKEQKAAQLAEMKAQESAEQKEADEGDPALVAEEKAAMEAEAEAEKAAAKAAALSAEEKATAEKAAEALKAAAEAASLLAAEEMPSSISLVNKEEALTSADEKATVKQEQANAVQLVRENTRVSAAVPDASNEQMDIGLFSAPTWGQTQPAEVPIEAPLGDSVSTHVQVCYPLIDSPTLTPLVTVAETVLKPVNIC